MRLFVGGRKMPDFTRVRKRIKVERKMSHGLIESQTTRFNIRWSIALLTLFPKG